MAANLYKVRTLTQKNQLVQAVMRRALKKNRLDINAGCEKFNDADPETGKEIEGPRANGHYDTEGHQCSDVYGFIQLDLTNKEDLKSYFQNIGQWLKDVYEIFSFRHPITTLQFMRETSPFRITRVQWVWCIESIDIVKSDLVDEKLEAHFGTLYNGLLRTQSRQLAEKEKEFFQNTTRQEVIEYMNKEYLRLTPWMWVSPVDTTVMVVDHAQRPFDMKDGWSTTMITSIVWEWMQIVAGWPGPVKVDVGGIKAIDTLRNELQKIMVKIKRREEREGDNGQVQGNRNQVVSRSSEEECLSCKADTVPENK